MDNYLENYRTKLDVIRKNIKQTSNSCVDLLDTSIKEVIATIPKEKDNLIRTISKDLSRYMDPWITYQKALSQMNTSPEMIELRCRIVESSNFFKDIWKEDSASFYRTRKFLAENLRNEPLRVRINQTLDCIIISLKRNLIDKYGRGI